MTSQKNNASSLNCKAIADLIIKQYKPNTAEYVNNALKDIFGPIFEAMLQGEMDNHLGYSSMNVVKSRQITGATVTARKSSKALTAT